MSTRKRHQFHRICEGILSVWRRDGRAGACYGREGIRFEEREEARADVCRAASIGAQYDAPVNFFQGEWLFLNLYRLIQIDHGTTPATTVIFNVATETDNYIFIRNGIEVIDTDRTEIFFLLICASGISFFLHSCNIFSSILEFWIEFCWFQIYKIAFLEIPFCRYRRHHSVVCLNLTLI